MIALWVGVGAFVGAPLRYLTERVFQSRRGTLFPGGTLIVNLVACFVLGVLVGTHRLDANVAALVGTGFCGALSTWSTFAFETVRLNERGERGLAIGYLAATLIAGLGLGAAGWAIAATVSA